MYDGIRMKNPRIQESKNESLIYITNLKSILISLESSFDMVLLFKYPISKSNYLRF
jgi:hypothetical protein